MDKLFSRVTRPEISSWDETAYDVREVDTFDERFETLSEELNTCFKICCVRDVSYLRWRFLNNPFSTFVLLSVTRKRDAKLCGFAAVKVSGEIGIVSEFFVRPEDDIIEALLVGVMRFGVLQSLSSLWFFALPPHAPTCTIMGPEGSPEVSYLPRPRFRRLIDLFFLTVFDFQA